MDQPQANCRNQLLRALAPTDFAALAPLLDPVRLSFQLDLEIANLSIDRVCFPSSGIISVVACSPGLNAIEVGLIGAEGMTGLTVVMGQTRSPQNTYVQVPGLGHWMGARALSQLLETRPAMRMLMLGYAHAFNCQLAQTALANGRAKIDVRLARWLLMAADRIDDADMPLTHDLLAVMLGVRRPGVTDGLHRLEGERAIRARRSAITIRDRPLLEAMAGGVYGVPEREYARVLVTASDVRGLGQTDDASGFSRQAHPLGVGSGS